MLGDDDGITVGGSEGGNEDRLFVGSAEGEVVGADEVGYE